MSRAQFLVPVFAISLPLILSSLDPAQQSPRIEQATPIRDGWGLALEAGQPFYRVGDALEASFSVTNFSPQDTFGFSLVRGGNGCRYSFTIEDVSGNTVWEPGTIVNGMFNGPGCLFGESSWDFSAGTQTKRSNSIPLVFQNRDHIGTQGSVLPEGLYKLRVRVSAAAPQPMPSAQDPGFPLDAGVPFRILP